MYKIIVCLVSFLLIAAVLLKLRSERLELTSQSAHLFHQIHQRSQVLWDLQTRISSATNPLLLAKKLKAIQPDATAPAPTTTQDQQKQTGPAGAAPPR